VPTFLPACCDSTILVESWWEKTMSLNNTLPKTREEEDHSDRKMVSSNWTPFAVQVVMQHYDQSSKAQQS